MRSSPRLYNWHGLARELGMSVARAKREISLDEYQDWMAFLKVEKKLTKDGDGDD